MFIDLNSDLGESFGNYKIGNDAEVMKYITSANIACGFHAGDPLIIEKTIKLATENNVAPGAHPGYPDLVGFGRRSLKLSDEELSSTIKYQVGAVKAITESLGIKLQHVKLHGAMYNDMAFNYNKAKVAAEGIIRIDPDLIFVGLAGSEMIKAAEDTGLKTANEFFADRAYNDDGTLVSRSIEGSVIHDTEVCLNRIEKLIKSNSVLSINKKEIKIIADTICVHGDSENAVDFVKNLNRFLNDKGIELRNLKDQNL